MAGELSFSKILWVAGGSSGGSDLKCYEWGEAGRFDRECQMRGGTGRRRCSHRRIRLLLQDIEEVQVMGEGERHMHI